MEADVAVQRDEAPPWARDGLEVEGLPGGFWRGARGALRRSSSPAGWNVCLDGAAVFFTGQDLVDRWRPVASAQEPRVSRSLAETMGAVLHELRSSGPLGLCPDELRQRVGDAYVDAVNRLLWEGRVMWTPALEPPVRVRLTACQRALDEAEARAAEGGATGEAISFLLGGLVARGVTGFQHAEAHHLAPAQIDMLRASLATLGERLSASEERSARLEREVGVAQRERSACWDALDEACGLLGDVEPTLAGAIGNLVRVANADRRQRQELRRLACGMVGARALSAIGTAVEAAGLVDRDEDAPRPADDDGEFVVLPETRSRAFVADDGRVLSNASGPVAGVRLHRADLRALRGEEA